MERGAWSTERPIYSEFHAPCLIVPLGSRRLLFGDAVQVLFAADEHFVADNGR
jgi:hypothetical protein